MATKHPVLVPGDEAGAARETNTGEVRHRVSGAGVAVGLDKDGVVDAWSAAARQLTGLSDARAVGKKLDSLCVDEELDGKFGAANDKSVALQLMFNCGDRGTVCVESVVSAKRDSAGALTGYEIRFPAGARPQRVGLGPADDRAPGYAAARRLEMPESPAFVVETQSFRIVDSNPAAARALGRPSSAMRGRSLLEILDPARNRARQEEHGGRPGLSYYRLADRTGAVRSYGPSLVPVRWGCRNLALCVLHDLTDCLDRLLDLGTSNEELSHLARHDPLTGLFNKAMFQDTLDLANSRVDRSGSLLGILYIDLDGFKPVNDRFGHDVGDALLVEVVRRLQSGLRSSDVMGRLGGDEFGAILENLRRRSDALKVARHLIERLKEPFAIAGDEYVRISASIGAVVTARTVENALALVAQADRTMYEAKSLGPGHAALAPAGRAAQRRRIVRRS